jgi:hypothetical protein
MTTLRKLMEECPKTIEASFDVYKLCQALFIYQEIDYWSVDQDKRLTCYFSQVWYCTDTYVGTRFYYLDDVPVAVSYKPARKSDENIEFISIKAANKLKEYLLSFAVDKQEYDIIDNLDEEIDDYYSVHYNEQLLHKTVIYTDGDGNDFECKVIKKRFTRNIENHFEYFYAVDIELPEGDVIQVDVRKLKIKYNQSL